MKKYPKAVWVGFYKDRPPFLRDKSVRYYGEHIFKPYHLHPGNEVARAQIVKDLNYLYECPSRMGAAMVAKRFGVGFKGMRFV